MFQNRKEAGASLAETLSTRTNVKGFKVLGIPRGGVVVAGEIARILGLELAPMHAVKIRAPWNPELAIGAVAAGIDPILDPQWSGHPSLDEGALSVAEQRARRDLEDRERAFGGPGELLGRRILLVDDGIATGYTVLAAMRSLNAAGVRELVVAAPVAAPRSAAALEKECDLFVALAEPAGFMAVGQYYREFSAVPEGEVWRILREARGEPGE